MPSEYSCALKAPPQLNFSSPRELPVGRYFQNSASLFNPAPSGRSDVSSRVQAFLSIHCAKAIAAKPVSAEQQAEIIASQRYYCNKQRQNDKTRRVLKSLWF